MASSTATTTSSCRARSPRRSKEQGVTRVLLNQHNPAQPIGFVTLRDTASALYVEGHINIDTQLGRDVHSNLRFGAVERLHFSGQ